MKKQSIAGMLLFMAAIFIGLGVLVALVLNPFFGTVFLLIGALLLIFSASSADRDREIRKGPVFETRVVRIEAREGSAGRPVRGTLGRSGLDRAMEGVFYQVVTVYEDPVTGEKHYFRSVGIPDNPERLFVSKTVNVQTAPGNFSKYRVNYPRLKS